jgi:uncharacterized protein YlxP (DUF503 family)
MSLGLLTLYIEFPGCRSLKEKRSRLRPLLARLHKEFNISAAEINRLDTWDQIVLGCALVSNAPTYTQRALLEIPRWIERNWPDVSLIEDTLELF